MIVAAIALAPHAVPSTVEPDSQLAAARNLWQQQRIAEAEEVLRELVAQHPTHAEAALLLAEVLRSQGRLDAACRVAQELCVASGHRVDLSLRVVRFAQQCDRHTVAARICEAALACAKAPAPELLVAAGHVARETGDFATARRRYLQALEAGIDLDRHHVLAALANSRRYTEASDPEIARFAAHFVDTRFSVRSRASAGFALAKARNDLGDYAQAAAALRVANTLVRQLQPWDSDAWRRMVATRQRERVAPASPPSVPDFKPVFIVGVPRSGTTLTAALLARTTGARDRGELRTLRFIAGQLIEGSHLTSPAALAEAASVYRRLAVQDDAPALCYLDQDPLNFRYLGIAAAMFPQARIIHVRRDPRDTALSLWSQDFAHADMAFSNDWAGIAKFMQGTGALMAHWKRVLHVPVHEVHYETLVAEPTREIAALAKFVGVPMKPEGVDAAPVTSASVWQVRQPLYTTSAGRWRHYAPYVPELARFGDDDQPNNEAAPQ